MAKRKQSKKAKPSKKVKNIVQSVIVNIHDRKTTKRSKRGHKKPIQRENEINVMATVPPNVVYQTGAYPSPQEPPRFGIEQVRTLVDSIRNEFKKQADNPVVPPVSQNIALPEIGESVKQSEFSPTANFISPKEVEKSEIITEKLYSETPAERRGFVSGEQNLFNRPSFERQTTDSIITNEPIVSANIFKRTKPDQLPELKKRYRDRYGRYPPKGMKKAEIKSALL